MNTVTIALQTAALVFCLFFSGCRGEPYTYESDNELKPGPGLFSGEDGEFNLVGSPKKESGGTMQDGQQEEEQKKE